MNELTSKACSHKFTVYWAQFQGRDKKYLDYMKCSKCKRVFDAEWLVLFLGYALTPENVQQFDELQNEE